MTGFGVCIIGPAVIGIGTIGIIIRGDGGAGVVTCTTAGGNRDLISLAPFETPVIENSEF